MPALSLRGRFVWHELMTTDPDAAARFYPAVTGWKVQTWEHNPAYRLWTMGGAPMAGLMALPDHSRRMGTPPAWLSYVGVPDVDATVRQATSLGARTYAGPQDIPVGRFAVLGGPCGERADGRPGGRPNRAMRRSAGRCDRRTRRGGGRQAGGEARRQAQGPEGKGKEGREEGGAEPESEAREARPLSYAGLTTA